jgi:glycosyltransferase involved in cell wall biosynthesis
LKIGGIVQDQAYFDAAIAPHLGGDVEFVGPVGPEARDELLRSAYASLHLTTIPERFGLAMAESMATGTPVVGIDLGSVREVVEDGKTGFVVPDVAAAIEAIGRIDTISRTACRTRVECCFSVDAMVEGYLDAYRKVLGVTVRPPSTFAPSS